MNGEARIRLRWPVAVVMALALVAVGAIGSYLIVRPRPSSNAATTSSGPTAAGTAFLPPAITPSTASPLPDVSVNLSKEAVERAGITVASVGSEGMVTSVRLPAVVEPNAYNHVVVTSVISGRLTRVLIELGSQVRQGQTMATIFSPQLAEAQTQFIAASAQLAAHERELARVEKLVAIGSASRQELERLHAEHTAQRTTVESARSRLELLGMSREALDGLMAGGTVNADAQVPAPISGILTGRSANVGQNIEPSTPLFTIVDLSTVWVVANLYEQDFSRVRVGHPATVTFAAYPQISIKGTVRYIDPQVSPETRTAKARIEVPNPRRELRLGMLAEVQIGAAAQTTEVRVPKGAVQNIGDRTVVYLASADASTRFTEREVRLGPSSGDSAAVVSGLAPGDLVVTKGSFFLRAERERLGIRQTASGGVNPSSRREPQGGQPTTQTAKVLVTEQGFEPASITLRAGILARLTFIRTTDKTCGTEVVFPTLNIKRALPLNQPVEIEFTPIKGGDTPFACGMNMLKGVVVVVE